MNFWSSCLCARVTGLHHHSWFTWCWRSQSQNSLHARHPPELLFLDRILLLFFLRQGLLQLKTIPVPPAPTSQVLRLQVCATRSGSASPPTPCCLILASQKGAWALLVTPLNCLCKSTTYACLLHLPKALTSL